MSTETRARPYQQRWNEWNCETFGHVYPLRVKIEPLGFAHYYTGDTCSRCGATEEAP